MDIFPSIVEAVIMKIYRRRSSCFFTNINISTTPASLQAAFLDTVYLNCSIPVKNQEISNIVEIRPMVSTR